MRILILTPRETAGEEDIAFSSSLNGFPTKFLYCTLLEKHGWYCLAK